MKVIAPNKEYTGVSASVPFVNGEGETDNPHLIQWFREHGYTVEDRENIPSAPKPEAEDGEQPGDPDTNGDQKDPTESARKTKKPGGRKGSRKNKKADTKVQPAPKPEAGDGEQPGNPDGNKESADSDNTPDPDAMSDSEGEQ